ncbi:MAG: hypothetical protein WC955_06530 [Elusimicrobiota bacterium]
MNIQDIVIPFTNHPKLFVFTIGLYILCVLVGMLLKKQLPKKFVEFIHNADTGKAGQTEKIFGKYREGVKEGKPVVMLKCAGIVFVMNMFGNLMNTFFCIFVLPIVLTLIYTGVVQGIAFTEIKKGTTRWSGILYIIIGGLEWLTYPLAYYAGLLIPAAVFFGIFDITLMIGNLVAAGVDMLKVYLIITVVLFIQAPLELLYVRKVLQSGGSGIPLEPY